MRVIAIDPGYERLGVAVVEKEEGKERLIFSECFQTSPETPHYERLSQIYNEITNVIRTHSPTCMAIETLFFNQNQKTAIKVAEARGVILAAGANAGLEIEEYAPQTIKVATTGQGNSSKDQVTEMTKKLVLIEKQISYDDEYDAIAVGLTCLAITDK